MAHFLSFADVNFESQDNCPSFGRFTKDRKLVRAMEMEGF